MMTKEVDEITMVMLSGLKKCLDRLDKKIKRDAAIIAEQKALIIAKKEQYYDY